MQGLAREAGKDGPVSIDLTSGPDPSREWSFTEPSATPGMRDATKLWVWDDEG
jgi:hypothetical protein